MFTRIARLAPTLAAGACALLSFAAPADNATPPDGEAEFAARWVVFPSGGGHWGRGPQSSASACADCHPAGGRAPYAPVLRLSVPGTDPVGGPRPHPAYGLQLDTEGVLGRLLEEGGFRVEYRYRTLKLADGTPVELREPRVRLIALWYGPLGPEAILSLRLPPQLHGAALLEQVPDAALEAIAARQRALGYRGQVNRVWSYERTGTAPGRFGHKAAQPTLTQQVAAAFMVEMGVNSRLFPMEDCWPAQLLCYDITTVSGPEVRDEQLGSIARYLRALAPPAPRGGDVARGAALFEQAQCAVCHVPALPLAGGGEARAYTDLLLHDLGDDLADGRREFLAGPRDWRTAPLWGLGRAVGAGADAALLHDGRARTLTEAILWHGGEAQPSRDAFVAMRRQEREALLDFLRSL